MMLSHDTLMGQCTIDLHDVVFAKNAEAKWHVLTNPETAVTKVERHNNQCCTIPMLIARTRTSPTNACKSK